MRAHVLVLIACLLLAGCATPEVDTDPGLDASSAPPEGQASTSPADATSALANLPQAQAAADDAEGQLTLAWISGTEASDEGGPTLPTGQARTWTYAFQRSADGALLLVEASPAGLETTWHEQGPRFQTDGDEIDAAQLTDTPAVAQALSEAIRSSGASWDQATYWLSTAGDTPLWQAVARLSGSTAAHVQVDAVTGQALETTPGTGFEEAREAAGTAAQRWKDEARLIEAYGPEAVEGTIQDLELGPVTLHDVAIGPDAVPGDGRVPAWWFLFSAPEVPELLVVRVDISKTPTPGEPIPVDGAPSQHLEQVDVAATEAAETVAAEAGLPPNAHLVYHLVPASQGPLWRIGQDRGDGIDWWLVDATEGTLIGPSQGQRTGEQHPGRQATADLEGTYTLIWIHGHEVHDPPPEDDRSCTVTLDHDVHTDDQVLQYSNRTYPFEPADLTSVIAFSYWDRPSGCPEAYQMHPDTTQANATLGQHGELEVSLASNGTAHVPGQGWLDPGENLTISYTEQVGPDRWMNGTITVDHLGAWPRSGLWPLPAG